MDTLEIQNTLLRLGFAPGPADGLWGKRTEVAVKAFQTAHGLVADGKVGPLTLHALQAAVAEPAEPRPTLTPGVSSVFVEKPTSRRIEEVIIHCTATPEGRDVSVETIRGWHIGQGWVDIGYHWVVLLDGTVQPGRPESRVGSHVAGHNAGTLGVVYVGGVDVSGKPKDTRTPAQREALLAHVKALIARYPTIKKVSGHNQYAPKACPSFDVRKDPLGKLV